MVRSMTGFGRYTEVVDGRNIIVEIKSVNHRYFEFSSRVSRGYGFLDEKLKSYLQTKIARGKVDVYVSVETLDDGEIQVLINHDLADAYVKALKELAARYDIQDDISVSTLSRYSDVFSVHKAPEDEEKVWNAVKVVLDQAYTSFMTMRETALMKSRKDSREALTHIPGIICARTRSR